MTRGPVFDQRHEAGRQDGHEPQHARPAKRAGAGMPRFLQRRALKVDSQHSPLEREADAVAEQIIRMPDGAAPARITGACDCGGDCPECRKAQLSRQYESVQTKRVQPGDPGQTAPPVVHEVLRSPGQPLDAPTRAYFEPRFHRDFSGVRVHTDSLAADSARQIDAHGYTAGNDIVFAASRFAPTTQEGITLLAHELTHVLQQSGMQGAGSERTGDRLQTASADAARVSIQRDVAEFAPKLSPGQLLDKYESAMDQNFFQGLASNLYDQLSYQPSYYAYLRELFDKIDSDYEDNVGAAFVEMLSDSMLDQIAATADGRATLDILYAAMITGDVSSFQRKQADRALFARTRQISPEDYVAKAKRFFPGRATPIFPVRFMRITGGDYAPPEARLLANGMVRVKYPVRVKYMETFAAEIRTLPDVFTGTGFDFYPDVIVGIKQYEQGGQIVYLPAVALIDFSNQAIQSTSSKIVEVSMFAATFGTSGAAVAGTRWARAALWADRVAQVVEIASVVIQENRGWIIEKFGTAGRYLVKAAEIANTAVAIYGLARLGGGAYQLAKDLRGASRACREHPALQQLDDAEKQVITKIDDETDALARELDEAAAARPGTADVGPPKSGAEAAPQDLTDLPTASPDARKTSVARSSHLDEPSPQQLRNEIDEVMAHPELVRHEGTPPRRHREMGEHDWVDSGGGVWCRESNSKHCVVIERVQQPSPGTPSEDIRGPVVEGPEGPMVEIRGQITVVEPFPRQKLNEIIPRESGIVEKGRRLTDKERKGANVILGAFEDAVRGDAKALYRLAPYRMKDLERPPYIGWKEIDLLEGNPGGLNQMRIIFRIGQNKIEAMVRQMHGRGK